jgi:hypothetical protein
MTRHRQQRPALRDKAVNSARKNENALLNPLRE